MWLFLVLVVVVKFLDGLFFVELYEMFIFYFLGSAGVSEENQQECS